MVLGIDNIASIITMDSMVATLLATISSGNGTMDSIRVLLDILLVLYLILFSFIWNNYLPIMVIVVYWL